MIRLMWIGRLSQFRSSAWYHTGYLVHVTVETRRAYKIHITSHFASSAGQTGLCTTGLGTQVSTVRTRVNVTAVVRGLLGALLRETLPGLFSGTDWSSGGILLGERAAVSQVETSKRKIRRLLVARFQELYCLSRLSYCWSDLEVGFPRQMENGREKS